eukprot:c7580_g1_i1.p1 GENE.c7580_g1_i1~~c7580_g1_i1.p1  ORF type:complete len:199 (-),score=33.66 c7580_g1_i1:382-978(-)
MASEERMFTSLAVELLRDLKRNAKTITPYDDNIIRKIVEEMSVLFETINTTIEHIDSDENAANTLEPYFYVHHHSLLRNKRCLLAYLEHRIKVMMKYNWQLGRAAIPPNVLANLSASESRFLATHDQLLGDYVRSTGVNILASIDPPKSVYVEVRVLRNEGQVQLDSGSVVLTPGTTHLLVRSEVEHLIRQGVLEQVG